MATTAPMLVYKSLSSVCLAVPDFCGQHGCKLTVPEHKVTPSPEQPPWNPEPITMPSVLGSPTAKPTGKFVPVPPERYTAIPASKLKTNVPALCLSCSHR